MKKICFLLSLTLALSVSHSSNAQKQCGFDLHHQQLLKSNAQYANFVQQNKAKWAKYAEAKNNELVVNTPNGPIYEIPVVVHVVHTGGAIGTPFNPTDQQIKNWIQNCNDIYAAQFSQFVDTNNGGVRIPIKLVLAKRSPSCTATSGIVRVNGSVLPGYASDGVALTATSGVDDSTLKTISRWPNDDYYNIWLVNYIDGPNGTSAAAYAYYPGAPAYVDGAVAISTYTDPGYFFWPVMSHEFAHALGVAHTFEGDNGGTTCPPNANCSVDGDEVCDTEPHIMPSGCPTGINSCTGVSYNNVQHNIMSYASCPNRFTAGQRTKMLYNLLNNRPSLLTSLGTTAIGAVPKPTLSISVNPATNLTVGQTVTFTATVTNGTTTQTYQWLRNGNPIQGATSSSYSVKAGSAGLQNNDSISVKLKNFDACAPNDSVLSNKLAVKIATGIETVGNGAHNISLFPNPNDGSFMIKGNIADKSIKSVKMEVFNSIGQSVYKTDMAVDKGLLYHKVEMSKQLPAGNYFIKMNDGVNAVIRFTVAAK